MNSPGNPGDPTAMVDLLGVACEVLQKESLLVSQLTNFVCDFCETYKTRIGCTFGVKVS